jgi:hypothetical protein
MTNLEIAREIYVNVYGDIDSKRHKAEYVNHIVDWLEGGSLENATIDELTAEWREVDDIMTDNSL